MRNDVIIETISGHIYGLKEKIKTNEQKITSLEYKLNELEDEISRIEEINAAYEIELKKWQNILKREKEDEEE